MGTASKKTIKGAKKTVKPDIDEPGKSAPPATSKPVIVSNRPLLKDPMVIDEEAKEKTDKEDLSHLTGPKLKPLEEPAAAPSEAPAAKKPPKKQQTEAEPAADETPGEEAAPAEPEAQPEQKEETRAAEQTKHDSDVQKLIDSRKYELPINAVEKRKTKRFVVLGVLLAVLLALAWADVALDAGLVQVDGVKPVTHFFSN